MAGPASLRRVGDIPQVWCSGSHTQTGQHTHRTTQTGSHMHVNTHTQNYTVPENHRYTEREGGWERRGKGEREEQREGEIKIKIEREREQKRERDNFQSYSVFKATVPSIPYNEAESIIRGFVERTDEQTNQTPQRSQHSVIMTLFETKELHLHQNDLISVLIKNSFGFEKRKRELKILSPLCSY